MSTATCSESEDGVGDAQWIGQFLKEGSEPAFRALVDRHSGMVYAVCLRGLRDSHLAQDATQAVFIMLARKAAGIRNPRALSSWLFRTANSVVSHMRREHLRRKQREEKAARMAATARLGQFEVAPWSGVAEVLNETVMALCERYRQVLILRYLEGLPRADVARALGCSEETVKKRLARGLGQLRSRLQRRGVAVSLAALATYLTTEVAEAVPAGLATACNTAALASLAGALAPAAGSAAAIAKGTMRMMFWAQAKTAAAAACAAVAVGAGGVAAFAASRPERRDWSELERYNFQIEREARPATRDGNVVRNGGFDERDDRKKAAPAHWASEHLGTRMVLDRRFRYAGSAALKVEGDITNSVKALQQLAGLKPNTRYRLRFAVKTENIVPDKGNRYYDWGACGANVTVSAGKGVKVSFPRRASYVGSKRWTPQGFVFESGELAGERPSLSLGIYHASGTAWFDEVALEEVE
ncbi:MAG: sigma-70 family RNA polymerase sigma factor [Kiritimatiellae bacterium]|nr:sigma-70 family RNA polymerase sigma factor [Kiritimatiellia bacterium]